MPRMKFVLFAALFALCAVSTAFAADSWNVTGDTFPASLIWDAGAAVSVDTTNDGTTTWADDFALKAVDGPTSAAVAVNRWATIAVPVGVTVAPAAAFSFDFGITAPPITTLSYGIDATPTTPPTVSALDCNWILADSGDALITTAISANPISIGRFSDAGWAAPWVEECAARVPLIVGGYGGGIYDADAQVTRDQMAVFMQRAFGLPYHTNTGEFADVPVGYWAGNWIQSCKDAGIVGGYSDGYHPTEVVNRGQMAVFVARGMADGDSGVPTGPSTATFPTDVPTSFWAYKWIEYCAANGVVGGYGGGVYDPNGAVDRGQMAVFVYRAAMQPTGCAVVLAGPAVTEVDPESAGYDGWTSAASGAAGDPGFAYVGLDAVRAPDSLEVTFELRDAATPTAVATGAYTTTVSVDGAAAKAAAISSGNPYVYADWDIPAGLAAGDYILVVTVNGNEVLRRPDFTIN